MSRERIDWGRSGYPQMKGTRGRINSCVALRGASRAVSGILRSFGKTSIQKADRLSAWPLVSAGIQDSASCSGWRRLVPLNRIQRQWAWRRAALATLRLRTHRGTALPLGAHGRSFFVTRRIARPSMQRKPRQRAIAKDSDVVVLAKGNIETRQRRGPYLVTVGTGE